jgi:hypothetical protein
MAYVRGIEHCGIERPAAAQGQCDFLGSKWLSNCPHSVVSQKMHIDARSHQFHIDSMLVSSLYYLYVESMPKSLVIQRLGLMPLRLIRALTVPARLWVPVYNFIRKQPQLSVNGYKFSLTTVAFSSWQHLLSAAIRSVSSDSLPGIGLQFVGARPVWACRSARRLKLGKSGRLALHDGGARAVTSIRMISS